MKTLNLTRKDSKTAGNLSTALILIFDAINAPVQHKALYQNNLSRAFVPTEAQKSSEHVPCRGGRCPDTTKSDLELCVQVSRCRVVGTNRSRRE